MSLDPPHTVWPRLTLLGPSNVIITCCCMSGSWVNGRNPNWTQGSSSSIERWWCFSNQQSYTMYKMPESSPAVSDHRVVFHRLILFIGESSRMIGNWSTELNHSWSHWMHLCSLVVVEVWLSPLLNSAIWTLLGLPWSWLSNILPCSCLQPDCGPANAGVWLQVGAPLSHQVP